MANSGFTRELSEHDRAIYESVDRRLLWSRAIGLTLGVVAGFRTTRFGRVLWNGIRLGFNLQSVETGAQGRRPQACPYLSYALTGFCGRQTL